MVVAATAQEPLRMPLPVAATGSRARKPKSEASNCSGTVAKSAV